MWINSNKSSTVQLTVVVKNVHLSLRRSLSSPDTSLDNFIGMSTWMKMIVIMKGSRYEVCQASELAANLTHLSV